MGEGVHLLKPSPRKNHNSPSPPPLPRDTPCAGRGARFFTRACKSAHARNQTPRRKTRPVVPRSTPGLLGFAPIFPPKLARTRLCARSQQARPCAPNASSPEASQSRGPLPCAHAPRGSPHRSVQPESTSASVVAGKLVSNHSESALQSQIGGRVALCLALLRKNISSA